MLRVVTRLLPVWITDGSRMSWEDLRSWKGSWSEMPTVVRLFISR